jgi:hypothetical protein
MVMVSPIDQRDPHRRIAERTRRGQAAELAANDHNVWSTHTDDSTEPLPNFPSGALRAPDQC